MTSGVSRRLGGRRPPHQLTLAILAVAALSYALSQTLVVPALPQIQQTLDASTASVTHVLTVYLLAASVATPIAGRLGDMFGKERVLVIALAAFGAGSLIAALSPSIEVLVAGRAVQGVGGAVFPLAFGIIRDEFPRERVPQGIGLISATFGVGGGAGLLLSGVLVEQLGYEWIFWLALIVVAVAIVATHLFVPESPVKSPARIDWGGAALMSAGLVALLIALSQGPSWGWGSARVLGLGAAGVLILVVWVRYELGVRDPLVDMRMMRGRAVLSTNLTAFLVGFGMFGSFILVPQFVQTSPSAGYGFGASTLEAGLFMAPSAAVMLLAGPSAGSLGARFGSKLPLLVGTCLGASGMTLLASLHADEWTFIAANTVLGLGIGFAFASLANLVVEAVEQWQTGVATGMNTIMRMIGGSLGGQLAASIVAGHVAAGSGGVPSEAGFTLAFVVSAAGIGAAFLLALSIPSRRLRGDGRREAESAAAVA